MKKFLFSVSILFFIACGIFGYWVFIHIPIPESDTVIAVRKVYSPVLNDYIYLRRESRGLNYEVKAVTISSEEKYEPQAETDYVYNSPGTPLFYLMKADTLIIYTYSPAIPPVRPLRNFKVRQIELTNSELKAMQKNFRTQSLGIF